MKYRSVRGWSRPAPSNHSAPDVRKRKVQKWKRRSAPPIRMPGYCGDWGSGGDAIPGSSKRGYGVFLYSVLDAEETNGEDAIPDLVDIVMDKLLEEKLYQCLGELTKEEQELIFTLFFQDKGEH